jgi:hypothetical protein
MNFIARTCISLVANGRQYETDGLNYEQYIANIRNDRFAKAVKLADLRDNMDLTRLSELTEKDIERTKKYHKSYIYLLGDGRFLN